MQEVFTWLSPAEVVVGDIYRLAARRQRFGVWTGRTFVGVQWEFDDPCLFNETHWDQGGSAKPLEAVGRVPEEVDLVSGWTECATCGRRVRRLEGRRYAHDDGIDEHEAVVAGWTENQQLFDLLFILEPDEPENLPGSG